MPLNTPASTSFIPLSFHELQTIVLREQQPFRRTFISQIPSIFIYFKQTCLCHNTFHESLFSISLIFLLRPNSNVDRTTTLLSKLYCPNPLTYHLLQTTLFRANNPFCETLFPSLTFFFVDLLFGTSNS